MEISKEQIKHLAHLSRLELSEAEIDAMQGDMSKILDFVAQVEKLDLEGVEPLTQMSKSVNVMRQDEVANMISKEDALADWQVV